jgi:hypothetical protein
MLQSLLPSDIAKFASSGKDSFLPRCTVLDQFVDSLVQMLLNFVGEFTVEAATKEKLAKPRHSFIGART